MTDVSVEGYEPKVRYSARDKASIDDYEADFSWIWERDLSERSVFDQWLHVVDHASRVARAIRLDNAPGVIEDLAYTTAWLLSFVNQCRNSASPLDVHFSFGESTSDLIWNKFPGQCASCFDHDLLTYCASRTIPGYPKGEWHNQDLVENWIAAKSASVRAPIECSCLARAASFKGRRALDSWVRIQLDHVRCRYADVLRPTYKPTDIVGLENLFHEIFKNQRSVLSLQTVAFHLLEEVGDASQAFKDCYTFDKKREAYSEAKLAHRKRRLQEEIADVLSWLLTITEKVRSLYFDNASEYAATLSLGDPFQSAVPPSRFSDVLWSKYGRAADGGLWDRLKCPGCEHAPCRCPRELRILWRTSDKGRIADTAAYEQEPPRKETREAVGDVPPASQVVVVTPVVSPQLVLAPQTHVTASATATATATADVLLDLYRLASEELPTEPPIAAAITELDRELRSPTPRGAHIEELVAELLRRVPERRRQAYVKRVRNLLSAFLVSMAGSAAAPGVVDELSSIIDKLT